MEMTLPSCVSYLLCWCDKTGHTEALKEGRIYSAPWLVCTVHHGREGMAAGARTEGHIVSAARRQTTEAGVQLASLPFSFSLRPSSLKGVPLPLRGFFFPPHLNHSGKPLPDMAVGNLKSSGQQSNCFSLSPILCFSLQNSWYLKNLC